MVNKADWNFDREGRIAGWESGDGLVCAECALPTDGNPATMEDAGYHINCCRCGKRIS